MNQPLKTEGWNNSQLDPKNIADFCGAQLISDFPDRSDHGFHQRSLDKVKANAISQLENKLHYLWPNATQAGSFN